MNTTQERLAKFMLNTLEQPSLNPLKLQQKISFSNRCSLRTCIYCPSYSSSSICYNLFPLLYVLYTMLCLTCYSLHFKLNCFLSYFLSPLPICIFMYVLQNNVMCSKIIFKKCMPCHLFVFLYCPLK